MKLIELHILQSFPVSCLNRDELGVPKSAIFGGVRRARISSQCLKRAIREYAQDHLPEARFGGERTRRLVEYLATALEKNGIDAKESIKHAEVIANEVAKLDPKSGKDGAIKTAATLTFLSPDERDAIASSVAELLNSKSTSNDYQKHIDKYARSAGLSQAADIAIFGRMVASMPSLTLEGAGMFSHALSTHRTDNDLDFFSAVDDCNPVNEDQGVGMIGTLEFNSAVYYRYAALNLDLLFDAEHLGRLNTDERRQVLSAFIKATALAVPGARKNTMNAHVPPSYMLGIYKGAGQPFQLINAFEIPVKGTGIINASRKAIEEHHKSMKATWGVTTTEEVVVPDVPLSTFIEKLTTHVI